MCVCGLSLQHIEVECWAVKGGQDQREETEGQKETSGGGVREHNGRNVKRDSEMGKQHERDRRQERKEDNEGGRER